MGFGETRTSANHKSREITNFAHHLSELFLVGNWQRERERKKKSGLRRKLSVHIGFWDDAIGLTVSNSKVFSSDFQSFIFTSVLIIYIRRFSRKTEIVMKRDVEKLLNRGLVDGLIDCRCVILRCIWEHGYLVLSILVGVEKTGS